MIMGFPAPWPVGLVLRAGLLVKRTWSTCATSPTLKYQSTSSTDFCKARWLCWVSVSARLGSARGPSGPVAEGGGCAPAGRASKASTTVDRVQRGGVFIGVSSPALPPARRLSECGGSANVEFRLGDASVLHAAAIPGGQVVHGHPPALFLAVVPVLLYLVEDLQGARLEDVRDLVVVMVQLVVV